MNQAVAGQFAVLPVLQLQDGSYVGQAFSFFGTESMVAFDASGNVNWTVPGYTVNMATADGSIVAQSTSGQFVSFDQNGTATDQIASFPIVSWKRAYDSGSRDAVVSPVITPMVSSAAVSGGNFTGNGTSLVHHSIGVWWCSPTLSGSCAATTIFSPLLANPTPVQDLAFGYAPTATFPNQSLVDFSGAHPDWQQLIINNARTAIEAAFDGLPVMVQPATGTHTYCPNELQPGIIAWIGCNVWPKPRVTIPDPLQEHVVYMIGNYSGALRDAGVTTGDGRSYVFYQDHLQQAQWATGVSSTQTACATDYDISTSWCALSPTYSTSLSNQQVSQFFAIMGAIGTGLGNTAAHELGHQYKLPQMDCDDPNHQPCPGGGAHDFLHEFYSASGLPLSPSNPGGGRDHYRTIGLSWTVEDILSLTKALTNK
ncbi:MAG: hypothetical protein DMG36_25440 [Acidobacteria bacterium]|nr:MAG: hypothetical protein DMG36_25440 [Acidobacteriota bacterium]